MTAVPDNGADRRTDDVLVEIDGPVAVITLNRPRVHNALNAAVLRTLSTTVRELDEAGEVRAVVITGAGPKSFCAGADLDELAGLDVASATEVLRTGQQALTDIATARVPIVTAVNGIALGGGFELVLASTFPIVSTTASFGLPESGLGLIPGYGGTQRLPKIIGRAAAAHLMLSGSKLSAQRAHELGLTPLPPVAPEELREVALAEARTIAERGPAANAAILEALQTGAAHPADLHLESSLAGIATGGAEAREGVAAFKERRRPQFSSRRDLRAVAHGDGEGR